MAYPAKLTAEVRLQVYVALRAGADMGIAARAVGVARSAIYKLMDSDPEFREQCDEARNFADEVIVKRLYDLAAAGDFQAMRFWLKNRKRHEWRDTHEVAITDGRPHGVYRSEFPDGAAVRSAEDPAELPN